MQCQTLESCRREERGTYSKVPSVPLSRAPGRVIGPKGYATFDDEHTTLYWVATYIGYANISSCVRMIYGFLSPYFISRPADIDKWAAFFNYTRQQNLQLISLLFTCISLTPLNLKYNTDLSDHLMKKRYLILG